MQVDYLLPHFAGGRTMMQYSPFATRVSVRFLKSAMNRDLAQTFPQLHADLAATMSPQLLHSGFTAHELSRKAILLATARFVFPPLGLLLLDLLPVPLSRPLAFLGVLSPATPECCDHGLLLCARPLHSFALPCIVINSRSKSATPRVGVVATRPIAVN